MDSESEVIYILGNQGAYKKKDFVKSPTYVGIVLPRLGFIE